VNDRIHELLHRNLQEAFGEGDATRRRTAIEEFYSRRLRAQGLCGASAAGCWVKA
jgi:hypothetical protein